MINMKKITDYKKAMADVREARNADIIRNFQAMNAPGMKKSYLVTKLMEKYGLSKSHIRLIILE
jgi:Mor family transcriptional regulator